MNIGRFCLLLATAILICVPATSRGITLGQIDTFESGLTLGWTNGVSVQVQPNGLAGSSDHFLNVASNMSGQSTKLQVFSQARWFGNYLSAGVTGVEMDLKGQPLPSTEHIRIAIIESTSLFPSFAPGYVSTTAYDLPNDDLWHHVIFSLASGALTGVNSPLPLDYDLSNVVSFSILSSAVPSTSGDAITGGGILSIDNIHAIPEPAAISILLSGVVGIALLRRRRSPRLK